MRTFPFGDSPVTVQIAEYGAGDPVLILHGGAGPTSVDAFAQRLADEFGVRVIVPTHPGFAGTERQPGVDSIPDLAALYEALLGDLGVDGVLVIGNSIGGWIAAELAARGTPRVDRLILVDAVGLEVEGHPVVDFFALDFDQLAVLSYADPERFRIDPAALPPAAQSAMAASRAALRDYAGTTMVDATLGHRLSGIRRPTLVVWGDHDRVVDPEVGRAYAAAIPDARLVVMSGTGHLPQLESPDALLDLVRAFVQKP